MSSKRVLILGGTKGMGRSLARQLGARGDMIFLLGRDEQDLDRSVKDLAVRHGESGAVGHAICDLADPATFDPALEAAIEIAIDRGWHLYHEDLGDDPNAVGKPTKKVVPTDAAGDPLFKRDWSGPRLK